MNRSALEAARARILVEQREVEQALTELAKVAERPHREEMERRIEAAARAKRNMVAAIGRWRSAAIARRVLYAMQGEGPASMTPERRLAIAVVQLGIHEAFGLPEGNPAGDSAREFIKSGRMGWWVDLCGADGKWAEEQVKRGLVI